jgi:DNA-binding NarL/FixJ family response regulator
MAIRLVIADDHPLILDGLEQLLRLEPDFSVLARCANGAEALAAVNAHVPDILVLDLQMPGLDGLAVLQALEQEPVAPRVVVLTAALDDEQIVAALRHGVRGVVLKSMAPNLLLRCLRKVHAGERWLEHQSTGLAIDRLLLREAGAREAAGLLTARETEIVRMVSSGMRNREIAAQLVVTEGTVKTHLHNIYEKLGVDSRLELTEWAQRRGLT